MIIFKTPPYLDFAQGNQLFSAVAVNQTGMLAETKKLGLKSNLTWYIFLPTKSDRVMCIYEGLFYL